MEADFIGPGCSQLHGRGMLGIESTLGWLTKKTEGKKPPLFLPQLPKQAQLPKCEASTTCLAMPSSSTLGLKMAFLLKKAVFSPNVELDGIARQVVEASLR